MKNFSLAIILLFIATPLFSQHIGYRDETRKLEEQRKLNVVKEKPAPKVYKDMCPGSSADLPYLNNFVAVEVVKTLKEKYMGYLYSITSIKMDTTRFKYKVSVCDKGTTRIEFVDETGAIVP